jgi:hypothetical protein
MRFEHEHAKGAVVLALVWAVGCSSNEQGPGFDDGGWDATASDTSIATDSGSEGDADVGAEAGDSTADSTVADALEETGAEAATDGAVDGVVDAPADTGPGGDVSIDSSADSASDSHDETTTDSAVDASGEGAADASAEATADAQTDAGFCPSVDATANLMINQPDPTKGNQGSFQYDWDDSFGGTAYAHMTATTECGGPATQWIQANVATGAWIKIYPDHTYAGALYYLAAPLVTGTAYTADITVSGSGSYQLNVWDGMSNNSSASATVSQTAATTLTVPFTAQTGIPEFQVVVKGNDGAGTTTVDVTMWNLMITQP